MQHRGRTRRTILALAALTAGLAYLTWRIGWTLAATPWLTIPLVVAEVVAFARFGLGVVTTLPDPDQAPPPDAYRTGPSVELLVPTGTAGPDELARTLTVATSSGVADIRVLDASHRGMMAREAARFGARYEVLDVDPTGGSAALVDRARHTARAEVLGWIDAGDVPVPGFLDLARRLVDTDRPRVAVVQSAVDLINGDSLLHLVPDRDERALENDVAGPSLGRDGAAPWEGSGSLVRADALEAVGGLPSGGSPTHRAALRLARAGWGVAWSRPPAVRTVAPDTLGDYLHEAGDRSHGDWVTLFGPDTPLRPGRLGMRRRLAQLHASTAVLDGAVHLTYLAVLVAVLVTGRLPVSAPLVVLTAAFLGQLALRTAAVVALSRGTVGTGDATRQGLRLMGVHLTGLVRRPRRPAPDGGPARFAVLGRLPLLTVALLAVDVALVARGLTFIWPDLLPAFTDAERFLVMAAAVWAVVPMVDVLQVLAGRVQRRHDHRAATDLVAVVDGRPCRTVDLTPHGVGLLLPGRLEGVHDVDVRLEVPRLDGSTTALVLPARLRHVGPGDVGDGRFRAGASFTRIDDDARDALVEFCALTAEQRDRGRDAASTRSPDDLGVTGGGRTRTAFALLNVLALLAAGFVVAAGPAGAAPVGAGSGQITGHVLDDRGQPVAGACVWVWNGPTGASASTDQGGAYTLSGLSDGDYTIAANDCGANRYVTTFPGSTVWSGQATTFTAKDGATTGGADVQLHPAAAITGTVLDDGGAPLPQVCVSFVATVDQQQSWWWVAGTDQDGRYTGIIPAGDTGTLQFNDCASPQRVMGAWYPGVATQQDAATFTLGAGDTKDLGSLTMSAGVLVSGTVRDEDGAPVPDACVSAQVVDDNGWHWIGGSSSDASGAYQFRVPAGTYSLWVSDCSGRSDLIPQWYPDTPTDVQQPPTVDVSGSTATFDTTLHYGGRASGRVVDSSGRPATGVCVSLHSEDSINGDGGNSSWDTVGPDGTWTSGAVPPGRYAVEYVNCNDGQWQDDGQWVHEVRPNLYVDNDKGWSVDDIDWITIQAHRTTSGVDDDLLRAAHVKGRITVAGSGAPAPHVCIGGGGNGGGDEQRRTDDQGDWTASLLPGTTTLTFTDCSTGRGLQQETHQVQTREGDGTSLDLAMQEGPISTLAGTVRNGAGHALQPACVVAYVPNDLIGAGVVDADGTFQIPGLGNGSYFVAAFGCEGDKDPSFMTDPDDGTRYPPTWYPSTPIDMGDRSGAPDPAQQGVAPIVLDGSLPPVITYCFGTGCPPVSSPTTVPPTTAPPATAPPPTAPAPTPPGATGGGSAGGSNPFDPTAFTGAPVTGPTVPGPAPSVLLGRRAASTAATPSTSTTAGPTTTTAPPALGDAVAAAADVRTPDVSNSRTSLAMERAGSDEATPEAQGFPWDIAGGVALVVVAAVALLLVWRRRHPAFA